MRYIPNDTRLVLSDSSKCCGLTSEANLKNSPALKSEVGMVSNNQTPILIFNNYVSIKTAVVFSSYSSQYLRRLLRNGKLDGVKIGQLWLINKLTLDTYLENSINVGDRRYGPK
ncbi:MAG: hypothetical protein IIC78_06600 [Chloroflexi bacterium]|nr:hypothetical protein [Chloroflexota bacterium]